MSDLLTHVARLEMVDVDLDLEPQCEHDEHELFRRIHGGAATHYLKTSCGCLDGLRCAPIVAFWVGVDRFYCRRCGGWSALVHVEL